MDKDEDQADGVDVIQDFDLSEADFMLDGQ